jgi:hypothetical protein
MTLTNYTEERREKEEDFKGESVDKECVFVSPSGVYIDAPNNAIGDLLDSDGGGLSRSDVSGMCRRARPTIW